MNDTKRAKEPWVVADDLPTIIQDSSDNPRTIAGVGNSFSDSERDAIARLIAAAPELLEAAILSEPILSDHADVLRASYLPDATPEEQAEIDAAESAVRLLRLSIAKAGGR